MRDNIVPFNPLDKRHLGESVGQAMLRQPVVPMIHLPSFSGAGIYAIYYTGDFHAYESIAKENIDGHFRVPIYVGKAAPRGARKGGILDESASGIVLFNRLNQHRQSIEAAQNLNLDDFYCRYLVVDDIWIPLGETLLIAKFNPLWNTLIDGFGNHDPGGGRYGGMRPRWDVLHPGRSWAVKCEPRPETPEQIISEVKDYLRNNPPLTDSVIISI